MWDARLTPDLIRKLFDDKIAAAKQLEADPIDKFGFAARTTRFALESVRQDLETLMIGRQA